MMNTDADENFTTKHCVDHSVCTMKIGLLCTWKEQHMQDHKEIDAKFIGLGKWAIANLVALVLVLIAGIGNLAVLFVMVKGGGG